jgi:hypothetical protein
VPAGSARDEADRTSRNVKFIGQKPDESRVRGPTNRWRRYPSLKHALFGYAIDTIRATTRHQPHRESGRGVGVVGLAGLRWHRVRLSTLVAAQ